VICILSQYCSGDQIEKNEMGGYVKKRGIYRILVGKPEGMRPLGSPDLQEVGCEDIDWIDLAEDWDRWRALVNAAMNLLVP